MIWTFSVPAIDLISVKNSSLILTNKSVLELIGAITSLFLYESIILVFPELFFEIISLKADILSFVWHYSSDADTHTVETHIYRLRKKINDIFEDNNFIKSSKSGYVI